MHRSLASTIEVGQVFFIGGPKWETDYSKPPCESWHPNLTVMRTLPSLDVYFRPEVEPVTLDIGARALVIAAPGTGKHVEAELQRRNQEHEPCLQILCLVTTVDGHSFEAVVSAYQLWETDPRSEYPPTLEDQNVDPNWVAPEKPEAEEKEESAEMQTIYLARVLDRMSLEDEIAKLQGMLKQRHSPVGGDLTRGAIRAAIKMIRAKRWIMSLDAEGRAKYRLDE